MQGPILTSTGWNGWLPSSAVITLCNDVADLKVSVPHVCVRARDRYDRSDLLRRRVHDLRQQRTASYRYTGSKRSQT